MAVIATAVGTACYAEGRASSVRGSTEGDGLGCPTPRSPIGCARHASSPLCPSAARRSATGALGVAQVRGWPGSTPTPVAGSAPDRRRHPVAVRDDAAVRDVLSHHPALRRLADADGAHRDHDQVHDARHASVTDVDGTVHLSARFGAAQGAQIAEVFEAFVRAEFDADWADVRSRLGDDACPGAMARSERQRRADALAANFDAAVANSGGPALPVVNIVVDQPVFEAQLRAMVADEPSSSTSTTRPGAGAAPPTAHPSIRPTPSPPPSSATYAAS